MGEVPAASARSEFDPYYPGINDGIWLSLQNRGGTDS